MKTNSDKYIIIFLWLTRIMTLILGFYFLLKKDFSPLISLATFIILSFVPVIFNKKSSIKINNLTMFLYILLILGAIFLGKGLKFYQIFFWWDIFIHSISGIVTFTFGLTFCKIVGVKKYDFLIIFLLVFALALSWEIIEFICDTIFGSDNQEWSGRIYEPLIPRMYRGHGLVDSMMDTIYAILSACLTAIFYYRHKKTTL